MPALSAFAQKKTKILSQLSIPSEDYTDLSPKGSVDGPVRGLVDAINAIPSLCTTSSCSGRIAIYAAPSPTNPKGGGRWIFVSHLPLANVPTSLSALLASSDNEINLSTEERQLIFKPSTEAAFSPSAPLVQVKFEPLILHVLCESTSAARALLSAAQAAGYRESGIASLPTPAATQVPEVKENGYAKRVRKPQKEEGPVMVAIRTMGLGMDAPIGIVNEEGVQLVVSDAYVSSIVAVANSRFEANEERKRRLAAGIASALGEHLSDGTTA